MHCKLRDARHHQGMFKDKSKYPTLTRMSYCQCRLKLVFASIFRQFGWKHVALLLDRSDLFSLTVGKFGAAIWRLHANHLLLSLLLFLVCVCFHFRSLTYMVVGKNLEYGLKQEGLLSFVRELNGNEEEPYDNYLRDASMYARGKPNSACDRSLTVTGKNRKYISRILCLMQSNDWNSQWSYCRCEVIWCENLCWPLMHWGWPKATGHFSMWKYFR